MDTLAEGIVQGYIKQKGFGYILSNDGRLVFFECDSMVMSGWKKLDLGDHVTFDLEKTFKGVAEAINVKRISRRYEEQGFKTLQK
jgi:cold shock CspA family protein